MEYTYDKVWWPFHDWYMNLGTEARKEVLNRLEEVRLPGHPGWGKCDTTFMVDYSNRIYDAGQKVVYAWVTERGDIFYIGRGTQERAYNFTSRSKDFLSKIDSDRCKVYVLCAWVKESVADDIETMLIYHALERGLRLQNHRKRLEPDEVECLRETGAPCEGSKYPYWIDEYFDVLEAFDSLISHCLDAMLSDEGKLHDGKFNTDKNSQRNKKTVQ